jgi:hypothetical protein
MPKRKTIPVDIETSLFRASGRRCCICFGLDHDMSLKLQGQIAHLDQNPSNYALENLAYLCLAHHDLYDSTTSQSKGLTIHEVKQYRDKLYETWKLHEESSLRSIWPADLDVPLLDFCSAAAPTKGIPTEGIQFTDRDVSNGQHPTLYVTVYFKNTQYFGASIPWSKEKWLYLEANMRSAFNLRIQVRAFDEDVFELMKFLRNEQEFGFDTPAWNLQGPKPGEGAADYILVSREGGENRLVVSTFTQTNSAISIHARFSNKVSLAFADYLDKVGFSKTFTD